MRHTPPWLGGARSPLVQARRTPIRSPVTGISARAETRLIPLINLEGAKHPGFNAALTGAASDHFRQRLAPLLGQRVGGLEAAALLLYQRLAFKVLKQCVD